MKIAVYLAAVLALFGAGWMANGWRLGTELQKIKAEHAQTVADAATAAGLQLADAVKNRDALAEKLTKIDETSTAEKRKTQNEINTLRARVAAGSVGLRVAGTCPAVNVATTKTTEASGLDSGSSAVLDTDAGQTYFALRQNIIDTEVKLTACQGSLKAFSYSE